MIILVHSLLTDTLAEFEINSSDTVRSLKRKILNEFNFRSDQQRLVYQCVQLEDHICLGDYYIENHSIVRLELSIPSKPAAYQTEFGQYIKFLKVHFKRGNTEVECEPRAQIPVNASFRLQFRPNKEGQRLSLRCLKDISLTGSRLSDMLDICGAAGSKQRGYSHWTYHTTNSRLLLIEIAESDNKEKIDEIRYCWDRINSGYYLGDTHSWQRYTKKLPILCKLNIDYKTESIMLIPSQKLQPDTKYAIYVGNGVPILKKTEIETLEDDKDNAEQQQLYFKLKKAADGSVLDHPKFMNGFGVQEDQLIYFRTLAASAEVEGDGSIEFSSAQMVRRVIDGDKSLPQIHVYAQSKTLILNMDLSRSVLDLKKKLRSIDGFPISSQQLLFQGKLLENSATLQDCNVCDGCVLQLIYSKRPVPRGRDIYYADYIRAVYPKDGMRNVPLQSVISVEFVANTSGCTLQLDCFQNIQSYPTVVQSMVEVLGSDGAQQRGFTQWSKHTSNQRIYLLEIQPDMIHKLESIRYNWCLWRGKNGSYYGGDVHSWQRYTQKLPVNGVVAVNKQHSTVYFTPSSPLAPKTTYAILLANGVPALPPPPQTSGATPVMPSADGSLNSPQQGQEVFEGDEINLYGIFEDKLFIFETGDSKSQEAISAPEPPPPPPSSDTIEFASNHDPSAVTRVSSTSRRIPPKPVFQDKSNKGGAIMMGGGSAASNSQANSQQSAPTMLGSSTLAQLALELGFTPPHSNTPVNPELMQGNNKKRPVTTKRSGSSSMSGMSGGGVNLSSEPGSQVAAASSPGPPVPMPPSPGTAVRSSQSSNISEDPPSGVTPRRIPPRPVFPKNSSASATTGLDDDTHSPSGNRRSISPKKVENLRSPKDTTTNSISTSTLTSTSTSSQDQSLDSGSHSNRSSISSNPAMRQQLIANMKKASQAASLSSSAASSSASVSTEPRPVSGSRIEVETSSILKSAEMVKDGSVQDGPVLKAKAKLADGGELKQDLKSIIEPPSRNSPDIPTKHTIVDDSTDSGSAGETPPLTNIPKKTISKSKPPSDTDGSSRPKSKTKKPKESSLQIEEERGGDTSSAVAMASRQGEGSNVVKNEDVIVADDIRMTTMEKPKKKKDKSTSKSKNSTTTAGDKPSAGGETGGDDKEDGCLVS